MSNSWLKKKIKANKLNMILSKVISKIDMAFNYAEKSPYPKTSDYKLHVFKKTIWKDN